MEIFIIILMTMCLLLGIICSYESILGMFGWFFCIVLLIKYLLADILNHITQKEEEQENNIINKINKELKNEQGRTH